MRCNVGSSTIYQGLMISRVIARISPKSSTNCILLHMWSDLIFARIIYNVSYLMSLGNWGVLLVLSLVEQQYFAATVE